MLFHLNANFLPGGGTGVDIFFVISGYVVSASLFREAAGGVSSLFLFYAKRILRIVPALLACLLVTCIFSTLFIPVAWLSHQSIAVGSYSFWGLSNFILAYEKENYFSPRIDFNPFMHTWSLAIEEQFYLLYPIAFLAWQGLSPSWKLSGTCGFVCLALISFGYCLWAAPLYPEHVFYLLPGRLWELGAGGILFQFHSQNLLVVRTKWQATLCFLLGVSLLTVGFCLQMKAPRFFPIEVWAVLGTLFLLAFLTSPQSVKVKFAIAFENWGIRSVGILSYSLYLWHWPVFTLFRWTVGLESYFQILAALLATTALGITSFLFIENPLRESSFSSRKPPWFTILGGIIAIGIAWSIGSHILLSKQQYSLSVTVKDPAWSQKLVPIVTPKKARPCDSKYRFEQKSDQSLFFEIDPSHCQAKRRKRPQLFVIGDSHAETYATMLRIFGERQQVHVRLYSRGGCSIANLMRPALNTSEICTNFYNTSFKEIERIASYGDVLFFASLHIARMSEQWTSATDEILLRTMDNVEIEARNNALRETASLIERFYGKFRIIIDAPKPIFLSPAFRCSDWFNRANPVCKKGFTVDRNLLLHYFQPMLDGLNSLKKNYPEIIVWNPFAVLCPRSPCSVFRDGKPLFFDGDHLSGYGNQILYPSFRSALRRVITRRSIY